MSSEPGIPLSKRLEPVAIKAGLSDSSNTQVLAGDLKAADLLVTGSLASLSGSSQQGRAPIPNRTGGGRR